MISLFRRLKNKLVSLLRPPAPAREKPFIHKTAIIMEPRNLHLTLTSEIWEHVIVRNPVSNLTVGENTQIGPFCVLLTGEQGITIGNNVMIAPNCVFAAGNHEYRNLETPMRFAGSFSNGPILIEDDVWIGANCTICDNVKISKGSVIGANSLVNKDVAPYDIVGGVPIKVLSSRLRYKK